MEDRGEGVGGGRGGDEQRECLPKSVSCQKQTEVWILERKRE